MRTIFGGADILVCLAWLSGGIPAPRSHAKQHAAETVTHSLESLHHKTGARSKSYNPIELDGRWSKKQRSLDGLASTSSKCRVRSGERADDRREREEWRRRSVGRQRAQGG